ncbi:hypothetical protein D3C73_1040260 [compost metagenome]
MRERLLEPFGDVGQVVLQVIAQRVQPGFTVAISGNMRHYRQHRRGRQPVAGLELLVVGVARGIIADKAVGPGQRRDIEGFGSGGQQCPGRAGNLTPRRMALLAPHHIHMDLIADHQHIVAFAQLGHLLQFLGTPYLAGRVMRAAQQQNFGLRPCQQRLQVGHITLPVVAVFVQRAGQQLALITEDHLIKRVIGRGVGDDVFPRCRPQAD